MKFDKKFIELYYRIMQLSIILRKSKVIHPPALHFYHIANEIPVSSSILLQLNSEVNCKSNFFAHVSINAIKSKIKFKGEINFK